MKNAIILHGTGTKNTDFWFPWLKHKLEEKGYEVWLPQLPHDDVPNLEEWLPFVLDGGTFGRETILIGHSAGAQLVLSVLEKIKGPVRQAIVVAGYGRALRPTPSEPKDTGDFDWEAIKGKSEELIFINSDNDPWGCTDVQGRILLDHLGGKQIILKGEGHMGSSTYNQPYKEFPLILKLVS
ncbi:MAG: alpha/beta fold hydrolase [Patescibacteria group bacterium]